MGLVGQSVPVKERGKLAETYSRNEAPVRIDYGNLSVFTDPDAKDKMWVDSIIGEEVEKVSPHTGCAGVYTLESAAGKDVLIGAEDIAINRECSETDINGEYRGNFSYRCSMLDYRQAKDRFTEIEFVSAPAAASERGYRNTDDAGRLQEAIGESGQTETLPTGQVPGNVPGIQGQASAPSVLPGIDADTADELQKALESISR
jgi:hypothetical protein